MADQLEVETKLELDKDSFQRLVAGKRASIVEQTNYYFDDDWKLANHNMTLRVRVAPARETTLTFKSPVGVVGDVRTSTEVEIRIFDAYKPILASLLSGKMSVSDLLRDDCLRAVRGCGANNLAYVGCVQNRRHVIQTEFGVIEADHCKFADDVEYFEAEIDNADVGCHKRLVDYVMSVAPTACPTAISKFERFRRSLVKQER